MTRYTKVRGPTEGGASRSRLTALASAALVMLGADRADAFTAQGYKWNMAASPVSYRLRPASFE